MTLQGLEGLLGPAQRRSLGEPGEITLCNDQRNIIQRSKAWAGIRE